MKLYKLIGAIVVVLIIAGIGWYLYSQSQKNNRVERTSVITELRQLNRLETAAFTIEKIIDTQGTSGSRLEEFLFGDKLLLIAHGEVIAGIDLSQLHENAIRIEENKLTITLPPPEILVVSIDNQKTRVYDRQTGIFTKGSKDLEAIAREEAATSIRNAACEGGILDHAAESARKQLGALFQTVGFDSVTISIPTTDCI